MRSLVLATLTGVALTSAWATTPLQRVRVSSDVTTALSAVTLADEAVAEEELASAAVSLVSLGTLPATADLDGYPVLLDGKQLLSFDTTVQLPGGLIAEPSDVVRYDGTAYTFAFQGRAVGLPRGVNVDAVAVRGTSLLLSFDISVDLGSLRVEDEDLVLYDGAAFSLVFDGSAAGVNPALDLDAADYLACNGHLLLSFDGSGVLGAVPFGKADVLEYGGPASWEMAYSGPAHDPGWRGADLDAVQVTVDLGGGPATVFPLTVLAAADKSSYGWASPQAYRAVRGGLGSLATYGVDLTFEGTGTAVNDASLPAAGTGFWYLVKQGGCTQTSWQSTLGAEPGRDSAIP